MLKNIYIATIVLASAAFFYYQFDFDMQKNTVNEVVAELQVYEPVVVLELFTSQGCSSCPAADRLLDKVKKEYKEKVYALSYHVDYWNYIGWKDPFSDAKHAKKQRKYNMKFRNNSNYTPQVVVNGNEHFVGSNTAKMYDKINTYKSKKSANQISLNAVSVAEKEVSFGFEVRGSLKNKKLRALLVLDERTTSVKRGENRNRTLKNSNIVVGEKVVEADNAKGEITLRIPELVAGNEALSVMVLVENTNYDITAAAKQGVKR